MRADDAAARHPAEMRPAESHCRWEWAAPSGGLSASLASRVAGRAPWTTASKARSSACGWCLSSSRRRSRSMDGGYRWHAVVGPARDPAIRHPPGAEANHSPDVGRLQSRAPTRSARESERSSRRRRSALPLAVGSRRRTTWCAPCHHRWRRAGRLARVAATIMRRSGRQAQAPRPCSRRKRHRAKGQARPATEQVGRDSSARRRGSAVMAQYRRTSTSSASSRG